MKAWIAFNAWYNYSGDIAGKNDKDHIDSILPHLHQLIHILLMGKCHQLENNSYFKMR